MPAVIFFLADAALAVLVLVLVEMLAAHPVVVVLMDKVAARHFTASIQKLSRV